MANRWKDEGRLMCPYLLDTLQDGITYSQMTDTYVAQLAIPMALITLL